MDKTSFQEIFNVAHDCVDAYQDFCVNHQMSYKDFTEKHAQQFTSKVTYAQCFDVMNYSITNEKMSSYFEGTSQEEFKEFVMAVVYTTTLVTTKITSEVTPAKEDLDTAEEENHKKVMNALKDFSSLGEECCVAVMNGNKDLAIEKLKQMKQFVSTCFPDEDLDSKSPSSNLKC